MLQIRTTAKMKRDVKAMQKRGKDMAKLASALSLLAANQPLPESFRDHLLKGNMNGIRECHIETDWLLIYQIVEKELVLIALGTGSHSDLFK